MKLINDLTIENKKTMSHYIAIWRKLGKLHNTIYGKTDVIYKLHPRWVYASIFIKWYIEQEKIYGDIMKSHMDFTLLGLNENKEIIISPDTFCITHSSIRKFVSRMLLDSAKNKYLGVRIISDTVATYGSFKIGKETTYMRTYESTPEFGFRHINQSSSVFLRNAAKYVRSELLPKAMGNKDKLKLIDIANELDARSGSSKTVEHFVEII